MAKTKKTKSPREKKPVNVYTIMLIVAFVALSIGFIILWKQMDKYNWGKEANEGRTAMLMPITLVG